MYALGHYAMAQLLCRNHGEAAARAQEQAALAEEKGAPFWKPFGMANQGCALVLMGAPSKGIELLIAGIAMNRAARSAMWLPFYLSHLARAHADLGQFDAAGHCIHDAITAMEQTKEKCWAPEVHRVAGEIALMSGEPHMGEAEARFERALKVARRQEAKSFELRAATSQARLFSDQGRRDEARDLLTPVYDWFTEGFDTSDLKEARALLGGLQA
jgi:predicted ATPase